MGQTAPEYFETHSLLRAVGDVLPLPKLLCVFLEAFGGDRHGLPFTLHWSAKV